MSFFSKQKKLSRFNLILVSPIFLNPTIMFTKLLVLPFWDSRDQKLSSKSSDILFYQATKHKISGSIFPCAPDVSVTQCQSPCSPSVIIPAENDTVTLQCSQHAALCTATAVSLSTATWSNTNHLYLTSYIIFKKVHTYI